MYTVECIDPNTTTMIVVDMENDFVASGSPTEVEPHAGRAMLPQLQQASACCRKYGASQSSKRNMPTVLVAVTK
jgi:hypothetical protein